MSLFKSVHGCIFIYIYDAIQLFYINIVWSLDYTGLDRLKKKSKSNMKLNIIFQITLFSDFNIEISQCWTSPWTSARL